MRDPSRETLAHDLVADASTGRKALVLAPLGSGKTHTLLRVAELLHEASNPTAILDLFTAASTPEKFLAALVEAVHPFMPENAETIEALAEQCARDRHKASSALLQLLELLATRTPSRPFVWLIDEITEIRSLAYFPDLGQIQVPFARAVLSSRGAVATSSYLGLATDLFSAFEPVALPPLTPGDLVHVPSLRSDSDAISAAIALTDGSAVNLLPLAADMRETRDLTRSLIRLLMPGGRLEQGCRRRYEVLLLRSRGYAVSKRAAEVVAAHPGERLTDLFPLIGRTAGASRQYLRWLVEVGLLTQIKKRYDFADPVLGLWAGLYLGRGGHPTPGEVANAVTKCVRRAQARASPGFTATAAGGFRDPSGSSEASPQPFAETERGKRIPGPRRRPDRFEEID